MCQCQEEKALLLRGWHKLNVRCLLTKQRQSERENEGSVNIHIAVINKTNECVTVVAILL